MSKRHLIPSLVLTAVLAGGCGREPAVEISPAATGGGSSAPEAALARSPAPRDASVFFIRPADGDTVSSSVTVEFGADGVLVAKAGDNRPDSGHHHLIIDAGLPNLSLPIPANDNYVHFGDGSASTQITLAPGTHTLQMLLGDYRHIPHDPPLVSERITITVE